MLKNAQEEMVRLLAEASEVERRKMIKSKFESFESMPEMDRAKAMGEMLMAKNKLDAASRKRLTYTRLETLAEDFDPQQRKKLISSHMMSLMEMQKKDIEMELEDMAASMGQCHGACQMKLMSTMKEIMMELPSEKKEKMMKMLPKVLRSKLG